MSKLLTADRPLLDRLALAAFTILILAAFWRFVPEQYQGNQNYDYKCCYAPSARNWIEGKGFQYDNGVFAAAYPPGYPVLLAGQFEVAKVIGEGAAFKIFTIICDLAAVFGIYAAGRVVGGFWVARLAALALITYPYFLWMSKQPNSEVPFNPLVIWGFYGYLRLVQERNGKAVWKWAALSGIAWALAGLIRPIAVLAPVVMAGSHVLFTRHQPALRRILAGTFLVICSVATVMPWEIIAKNEVGKWILLGNNSGTSYFDGLTFGLPQHLQHPSPVSPDVRELMERAEAQQAQVSTTGGYLHFMREEASTHTSAFLKLMYIKLTRAWYATYEGHYPGINQLISLVYLIVTAIGLWWMSRASRTAEAWGIVAIVCYFWFMSVLVLPILRYMIPGFALMMLAVAVAVKGLADRWLPGLARK
jgi:4-amino-4-deoxy-L-arabinose transferase-like glycosyltransferase